MLVAALFVGLVSNVRACYRPVMATNRTPDAAFVADESFVPTSHKGLTYPFGGKEPGEGHESARSPSRRRVQAPGVPPPEWGPRAPGSS